MNDLQETNRPLDGKVLVSFSHHITEGFRTERVPFDKVEGLVRYRGNYSATAFRDGYRDGEHALPGQEMVILDFDGGYTIAEAMVDFEDFVCALATTRNHLREKHGVIAERYRVLIPTDKPVTLDVEGFKLMMAEVMLRFPHADPACKNIDRMYYGNPDAEVFFSGGEQLFAWEPCYLAAIARKREEECERQDRRQRSPMPEVGRMQGYETFFRNHFSPGKRNATLYRLACWMKDEGVSDAEERIERLNAESGCPVEHAELKVILRRVL